MRRRAKVIDRVFRGVGRIKRSAGTVTPRVFNRIQRRLDALADVGDLETLRRIRDGSIALIELLEMTEPSVPRSHADDRDKRRPCWVYVLLRADTDEVKIGTTADVRARVKDLQTGSSAMLTILAVLRGGERREAEIHKQFASAHIRGEWFRATPELLAWAASQAEQNFKHTISHTTTAPSLTRDAC